MNRDEQNHKLWLDNTEKGNRVKEYGAKLEQQWLKEEEKEAKKEQKKREDKLRKEQEAERQEQLNTRYALYKNDEVDIIEEELNTLSSEIMKIHDKIKNIKANKDEDERIKNRAISVAEKELAGLKDRYEDLENDIEIILNTNQYKSESEELRIKYETKRAEDKANLEAKMTQEDERLNFEQERLNHNIKVKRFIDSNPDARNKHYVKGYSYDEIYKEYKELIDRDSSKDIVVENVNNVVETVDQPLMVVDQNVNENVEQSNNEGVIPTIEKTQRPITNKFNEMFNEEQQIAQELDATTEKSERPVTNKFNEMFNQNVEPVVTPSEEKEDVLRYEEAKPATLISSAKELLKSKINTPAAKGAIITIAAVTATVLTGGAAAAAVVAGLGAAGTGYAVHEFNKGYKGK